jgi:hypothetical protein
MFLRVSSVHCHFIIFHQVFPQFLRFFLCFFPHFFPYFREVLEVERLELDHFWEIHRHQLEQRDQVSVFFGGKNGGKMGRELGKIKENPIGSWMIMGIETDFFVGHPPKSLGKLRNIGYNW